MLKSFDYDEEEGHNHTSRLGILPHFIKLQATDCRKQEAAELFISPPLEFSLK